MKLWILSLLLLLTSSGCAAMEKARLDDLDKSVTVSTRDPLYRYARVGMEPADCDGSLCAQISGKDFERQVEQAAVGACYEVVSSDEITRYAKHYGGSHFNFGTGVDHLGPNGRTWTSFGLRFETFQPDVRDVVVGELGLDAILKSSLTIGEPDGTTRFRPVVVDLRLMDSRGRQTLWQMRLQRDLMDDNDVGDFMARLGVDMREAVQRRASACGAPEAEPANETFSVREERIDLPESVHFELGSAEISRRSHRLLQNVARFIDKHDDLRRVRIEGHTDADGTDAENQKLSESRAAAVVDFLVQAGVPRARLEARGFGESKPIAGNDTIEGKAKNRRVEFIIVR